MTNYRK